MPSRGTSHPFLFYVDMSIVDDETRSTVLSTHSLRYAGWEDLPPEAAGLPPRRGRRFLRPGSALILESAILSSRIRASDVASSVIALPLHSKWYRMSTS